MEKKTIAVFDFDGTISPKESFIEFIKFTNGNFRLMLCAFLNSPFIFLYYLKFYRDYRVYPSQRLKERFFSFFFKGRSESEVEELGKIFAHDVLPEMCSPAAMRVIAWHKKQGHEVYILTSSSATWLGAWCKDNQLTCIGTEFETRNGLYTGKVKGKTCKGKEKLRRMQLLKQNNTIGFVFAYGNEAADNYYLEAADKAFAKPLNEKNVSRYLNL